MYKAAKDLFPLSRSLTGTGISKSYGYFEAKHPELHRMSFKSGERVFDWNIPSVWEIRDGYIEHESGNRYAVFSENNLSIIGYSVNVDIELTKNELSKYIYTREDMPDAVPYITSYYSKRWGFCLPHETWEAMPEGRYRCIIDSEFKDGEMELVEGVISGSQKEEIFFSSYLCHPSMANNEISGPVLLGELMNYIRNLKNRRFTYRFVLLPETIGSIAYLSRRLDHLKDNVIAGFNLSCVGDNNRYTWIESRNGNTYADQAMESALLGIDNSEKRTYLERGSDERQYCWPGVDLPVATFCRSKFGEYNEYHTSKDDLSFISAEGLQGSFDLMRSIIDAFETGILPRTNVVCEPNLGSRGLYPTLSDCKVRKHNEQRSKDELYLRMNVLAYSDGTKTIFELATLTGCNLQAVVEEVKLLKSTGLINVL